MVAAGDEHAGPLIANERHGTEAESKAGNEGDAIKMRESVRDFVPFGDDGTNNKCDACDTNKYSAQ
jgi:hypothetical protein